jgi:hypothetical protein
MPLVSKFSGGIESVTNEREASRSLHPEMKQHEIWPGPDGYPWAMPGAKLYTREALLRRVGPRELLCTWTTGGFSEPWAGNITMIRRSTDDGETWEDAGAFQHPVRGLFTTELFSPREGEIHAFVSTYGNAVYMTELMSYRCVSADGGRTWGSMQSIPGGIHNVWPNRGLLHSSGRWIIPAGWAELIGDEWAPPSIGRTAAAARIGTRLLPADELPYGSPDQLLYRVGNEWADRNHRYAVGAMLSDDDGQTFRLRGYIRGGLHGHLIEPQVVELLDGKVVMLIRSHQDGRLWRSESIDAGETWKESVRSEIPNPGAKVNILRASDGRIFMIHNPVGNIGRGLADRKPLSLWVSGDDMRTWPVRVDLVNDTNPNASLNYPSAFLDETAGLIRFVWEDTYSVYYAEIPMDVRGV